MVNNEKWLSNVKDVKNKKINIAKNGMRLNTKEKGNIEGMLTFNNRQRKCVLQDVLLVKDLRYNVLSIGKMEEAGLEVTFKNQTTSICYNGTLLYEAHKHGNLYELEFETNYMTNGEHSTKHRSMVKEHCLSQEHNQRSYAEKNKKMRTSEKANGTTGHLNILETEKDRMINFKVENVRLLEPSKQLTMDYTQAKGGGSTCKFKRRP